MSGIPATAGTTAKYDYNLFNLVGTFATSDIYPIDQMEKLTNEVKASVTPTSVVFMYQYHGCYYHYRYNYHFVWSHTMHLHRLCKCIPAHDESIIINGFLTCNNALKCWKSTKTLSAINQVKAYFSIQSPQKPMACFMFMLTASIWKLSVIDWKLNLLRQW